MPVAVRLPLQVFFEREARHPRKPFLVQPIEEMQAIEITMHKTIQGAKQFLEEAATGKHLKVLGDVIDRCSQSVLFCHVLHSLTPASTRLNFGSSAKRLCL